MSESTPQRIDDYEVIRELGHGGMGKVYQVRNALSDRIEAMKVILPDLAGRSEFAARFMREIKVLASLEHPNIAQLRTAFTANDQLIMIMEYVDGVTLADRLERGEFFPVTDALNYIDQVLNALAYAHGKHVIHRDIKPGNMMLTPQGVVKLMDFGLARSAGEVGVTVTGSTLGSLDFMSPEQVKSQPADERSDLYAVGVSLYQMVTHQRMFHATSNYSIMEAHIKETPRPPIEVQPALPRTLSDLIMMSVAKEPAQRFQTADAFRNALAQVCASLVQQAAQPTVTASAAGYPFNSPSPGATGPTPAQNFTPAPSPPIAPPAPAKGSRGVLIAVAAVVLLVLLAGAWMYKSRQQRETIVANATTLPQQIASTPAPTPPAAEANPPAQTTPPPTPPPARKRGSNGASGLTPGGGAADSQAAQDAAAAAAAQKKLLDDMETEDDHLESRAAAIESGMGNLERQMNASGYGLRGDMVAARGNMRNDLAKAKQAMDAADTDRARHYLDLAHREVEKLEEFLGRR